MIKITPRLSEENNDKRTKLKCKEWLSYSLTAPAGNGVKVETFLVVSSHQKDKTLTLKTAKPPPFSLWVEDSGESKPKSAANNCDVCFPTSSQK